jgi:6-phosphogluconate dehydrogenase
MFPGKGPAFFPGGTLSVWNDVRHIVEAAAAKAADGRPCATMNGKGGAGSCVKMSLVAWGVDFCGSLKGMYGTFS